MEGKFTFTGGRGCTVIDYIIGKEVRDKVRRMKVGDRVDSDHHSVEMWMEDKMKRTKRHTAGREGWKMRWDEVDKREFGREMEGIDLKHGELGEKLGKIGEES